MAHSSDIEFAKLVLVLGFVSKEDVYATIREAAILQELGIHKRVSHIMYERKYLNAQQIQAILWAMFRTRKIRRFPARVVYQFSEQEDEKFLEAIQMPIEQLSAAKPVGEKTAEEKIAAADLQDHKHFPREVLIYCLDLQRQLRQKGFPRSILSILSAKGYLRGEYRNLVANIESKKTIISHPSQIKSEALRKNWEAILFSAWAIREKKITKEQADKSIKIWRQLEDKHSLSLSYGEVLHYLSMMNKGDLAKLGTFVLEVTNCNQAPRFHLFELSEEERAFIHSHLLREEKHQKSYRKCEGLQKRLQSLDVNISPEELMLHEKFLTREDLQAAQRKAVFAQDGKTPSQKDATLTADRQMTTLIGGAAGTRRQKRQVVETMMPFSLNALEKEFESHYLAERKALRMRRPETEMKTTIEELTQTQVVPFPEIEFAPTEDTAISPDAIAAEARPLPTPKIAGGGQETIYIPIGQPVASATNMQKISQLSYRIVKDLGGMRSPKKMFLAIFIVAAGMALIQPKFGPGDSSIAMLMEFLPFLLLGKYFGKIADRGSVQKLYFGGLTIFGCALLAIALNHAFAENVYLHWILRVARGIGLAAVLVAAKYCISRWYGPLERGKIMGFTIMIFAAGFSIGLVIPNALQETQVLGIDSLLAVSIIWTVISFATIFLLKRIKIDPPVSEDIEEEDEGDIHITKEPLLAAALYGIVWITFLSVLLTHVDADTQAAFPILPRSLIFFMSLGILLSSYSLGWLSDRVGAIPILTTLSVIAVLVFCIVPFSSGNMLKVAFAVVGVVIGGLYPLGFSWLLAMTDNERYFGVASGQYVSYEGWGAIVGCVCCGILMQLIGLKGFFILLSIPFIAYFYMLMMSPSKRDSLSRGSGLLGGMLRLLEPTES